MARGNKFCRNKPSREPLVMATYAAEGENAEFEYLDFLSKSYGLGKRFKRVRSHSDPCKIVRDLCVRRREAKKKGIDGDYWIAIFDREFTEERQASIAQARQIAKKNGIICIETSPSFEFWLRLHYSRTDKPYGSQKDVEDDLKQFIPNYCKKRGTVAGVMGQLSGLLDKACANALWINAKGVYGNCSEMPALVDIMKGMAEEGQEDA